MPSTFDLLGALRTQPATRQQRLLRLLVFLILGSSLVLFALIALNRTRQAESTAAALITQRAKIAKAELTLFFRPIFSQLVMIRALGQHGLLAPSDADTVKKILTPLLGPLDYVGTATLVSSMGDRADFCREGVKWSATFSEGDVDDLSSLSWYQGAWGTETFGGVYWDDPRSDDDTAALTASIAWRDERVESATQFAAAFHISSRAVERFIHELPIGEKGEVLLFTRDGEVMRLSKALDGYVQLTPRNEFFSVSNESSGQLADGLEMVDSEGPSEPVRWNRDNESWWFATNPLTINDRTIQVGLASRERTLLAQLKQNELYLIYLLLAVVGLGVLAIILLARQYGEQLRQILERPRYSDSSEEALTELIRQGEQERLELKSTMRWNLKAGKPGNEIARAWLKSLVAFLNTDGGTLLIGVEDNGDILGIEADKFPNEDKYLLHFNNLIKQHVGLEHAARISVAIRSIQGRRILVVDCEKSPEPVFLRFGDNEEFFVRVGSGTRQLPASKVLEYVKKR
jgi:hypothetical protein